MDSRERCEQHEEALRTALDGFQAGVWTAMPGIIESYDAAKMTVTVQPAIERVSTIDGARTRMTLLQDVPVVFPGGGGYMLTFPIAAGDECLVIFASRSIDSWWQSGGVQPPVSARFHSLSDGFALVGLRSLARSLSPPPSGSAVQLRSDSGAAYVEIKAGGAVEIKAPGKLTVIGNVEVTGTIQSTGNMTAGTISVQGHVHSGVQAGASNTGTPVP